MKRRIWITASTVVLALLVVGGVSFKHGNTTPKSDVEVSADVSKGYKNVSELNADAILVVQVEALDSRTFEFSKVPFTVSSVKIEKVFRGSINKGDQINILETGGVVGNSNFVFEGNKVLSKGDRAIVFLHKYDGPVTNDAYAVVGAYQGKFNIDTSGNLNAPKGEMGELAKVMALHDLNLN